ncbi:LacI family DNA-binding transcriptional regulator [Brevibacterium otitidis]|uniref:LacI family DNA-binding transcriptional regulator n=1 Tax=Brevibacterium otitidis TaxID=53364 RepID=A0ABV5X021_9MICO
MTIRDVAAAAGVSVSTVSHTFSGARPISKKTRDRVLAASRELGYVPNAHARNLRLGRSGMIGLILRPRFAVAGTPDVAETFNRLIGSAATAALRRRLGLVHIPALDDDTYEVPPMDGCVVAHPYENDETIRFLERTEIPFVLADRDPARTDLPWTVEIDYETGLKDIFEATSPDRRHVILMPGTEGNQWNREAERVYSEWCGSTGQTPEIRLLSEGATPEETRSFAVEVLQQHNRPVGLVFASSNSGIQIIEAAEQLSLKIPDDLSLAALTDSTHSIASVPSITSLDLAHEELTETAVELLTKRIAGSAPPDSPIKVSPSVRIRASSPAD